MTKPVASAHWNLARTSSNDPPPPPYGLGEGGCPNTRFPGPHPLCERRWRGRGAGPTESSGASGNLPGDQRLVSDGPSLPCADLRYCKRKLFTGNGLTYKAGGVYATARLTNYYSSVAALDELCGQSRGIHKTTNVMEVPPIALRLQWLTA